MIGRSILAMAAPIALLGCASDIPENVPERGTWEIVAQVDSLTVDGMIIPREDLPAQFTALETSKSLCGEPLFIDPEWQQDDLGDRTGGQCQFTSYDHSETGATGTGQCSINEGGLEFEPGFDVRANFDEQSFRTVVTMSGSTILPQDGNPHTIRIIAVQEGTRTGDC